MVRTVCLALAAVTLGEALQISNGTYDPRGFLFLNIALVLTAAGTILPLKRFTLSEPRRWLEFVLVTGIAIQLLTLFIARPAFWLEREDLTPFRVGLVIDALCVAAAYSGQRWLQQIWFPAFLIVQFVLGAWIIHWSPSPYIDVVTVHRAAIRALLRSHNPYAIQFPNIYQDSQFYNPAMATREVVLFGYPYPPLSLLLAVPGQWLAGEYRFAELTALVAAGALIGSTAAGRTTRLAACLLLTTPRLFFVLEQGWSEPAALILLAGAAFAMVRRPAWVPWMTGLLLVVKQYFALAAPLLLRYLWVHGRTPRRAVAQAVGIGAAVTLPFAFWNLERFMNAVVLLQFHEPVRLDSLSYVSWAARAGWTGASVSWAIAAACVGLALCLWRTPATAAGCVGGLTLTLLMTFAFGSKAFCNYYFFIVGALCCTLAVCLAEHDAGLGAGTTST